MGSEETIIRLLFVGDIALGNHPKTPGFGFYSKYFTDIPNSLAHRILPSGISPDVVFGNLEFPLVSSVEHPGTNVCCLGSTSYAHFLRQAGFTVLNVANNHCWEHGAGVFSETVKSLQDSGIKVIGIPSDFDPHLFLKIKDRRVAFLGCSARPRQGFTNRPGYNEFEKVSFLERIRDARRHADLVCVSIHWGEEFLAIPGSDEIKIARDMVAAGAEVVVGHHPHVLREMETYRNGVIAYSLGNFIGDMIWNPLNRETGCLALEAKGREINSKTFLPAIIDKDFFPRYLDESTSLRFFSAQMTRHALLNVNLRTHSYAFLARKALRNHQWLTFCFLLRNIFRYRLSTLAKIVGHGLVVRLQRLEG